MVTRALFLSSLSIRSPSSSGVAVSFSRSEEHTSELQSRGQLVCRLMLEKKTPIQELNQKTGTESGGQKKQDGLAEVLCQAPDRWTTDGRTKRVESQSCSCFEK